MNPTQEKTMERQKKKLNDRIERILLALLLNKDLRTVSLDENLEGRKKEVLSLLKDNQDSFRRKVEEEKVNALKKLQNRYKDVQSVLEEDEIPNYMGILELEIEDAEQRAKLKNIR